MDKPVEITLTGLVYHNRCETWDGVGEQEFESVSGTHFMPPPLVVGDLVLDTRLTAKSKRNISGGHANYGYGGYVRPMVWNGSGWSELYTKNFLRRDQVEYHYAYECGAVCRRVEKILVQLQGRPVRYEVPKNRKRRCYVVYAE